MSKHFDLRLHLINLYFFFVEILSGFFVYRQKCGKEKEEILNDYKIFLVEKTKRITNHSLWKWFQGFWVFATFEVYKNLFKFLSSISGIFSKTAKNILQKFRNFKFERFQKCQNNPELQTLTQFKITFKILLIIRQIHSMNNFYDHQLQISNNFMNEKN